MAEFHYVVPPTYDGGTLQSFLRGECGLSWRTVVRLKNVDGGMQVNGVSCRTIDRVYAGQTVTVRMPQETPRIEAVEMPLSIVFEDDSFLVLNKPPFIAVHPAAGRPEPTVANGVVAYLERLGTPGSFHPINRLDRNTSGLLLVGKHPHAVHALAGKTKKEYLAAVCGPLSGSGLIDCPLRVREGSYLTRQVGIGGKQSRTHYRVIDSNACATTVRLWLETGRTHQIRAHMAYIGHPLVGDTMYGTDERLPRHALHCADLSFVHPLTGEALDLHAPLPDDMCDFLRQSGLRHS